MSNVVVINRNKELWGRKFDGKLYSFPPGEAVTIPELAARYLFGYGGEDEDRARIVVRNGWQKNGIPGHDDGPEAAMKRLKSFIFKRGPEDEAPKKPEKKMLPQHREMTGINAISPDAKDDGKTILPRSAVRIPGAGANLIPPAAPAA